MKLLAQLDGETIPPDNLRDENDKVTPSAKHASLSDDRPRKIIEAVVAPDLEWFGSMF